MEEKPVQKIRGVLMSLRDQAEMELKIENTQTGHDRETITLDFSGSLGINLIHIKEGKKKGGGWMKWLRRDTERIMIKAFLKQTKQYLKRELKTNYPKLPKSTIKEGRVFVLDEYKKQQEQILNKAKGP